MTKRLRIKINECRGILEKIADELEGTAFRDLPPALSDNWKRLLSNVVTTLVGTLDLFPIRDNALDVIQKLAKTMGEEKADNNKVKYCEFEIDFSNARHLALASYITTTWSIYDRLSDVCGRLSGTKNLGDRRGFKTCEDFLRKDDTLGFGCNLLIQNVYYEPLTISYNVRNWLVHEGSESDGCRLFTGDFIEDGFFLSDKAKTKLLRDGRKQDEKIKECYLKEGDLLKVLVSCHEEADKMFFALLGWSAESTELQIRHFMGRYRL